jgi:hypothetical protein
LHKLLNALTQAGDLCPQALKFLCRRRCHPCRHWRDIAEVDGIVAESAGKSKIAP